MNNKEKIISIIVPIYNVADYLEQCLDSIYGQLKEDYELILVDDGSTDNSGNICEEYKKRFPTTILIHKKNGGLSDARNAGVDIALGKYIYFVDSDDWIAPNAIEDLLECAEKNQCEIVQSGFYYAYEDHLLCSYPEEKMNGVSLLSKEEAMVELIRNVNVKNFAWGKLYLASIVKKNKFPKGLYFEDSYWKHYIINEANRYALLYKPLYFYRQRNDSISGDFSIRNIDLLKGYEERLKFIKEQYPQNLDLILSKYWELTTRFCRIARKQDDCTLKNAYGEYWKYAIQTYERSMKYKIVYSSIFQSLLRVYNYLKRLLLKK